MRRVMFCLGVVGVVAFSGRGLAPLPVQAAADKAEICHFPGHQGDTFFYEGYGCAEGGNHISISVNACKAHGLKCE